MEAEEKVIVKRPNVECDGGGGPLGHPKIYMRIGDRGQIACPYCSRIYKLGPDAARSAGH